MKYTNYEIAGGSVAGRLHARAGRNNQDAFAWAEREGIVAAAVCDGCGSAPHSEAGARMGARIAVEELLRHGTDLAAVREAIVGRLEQIDAALQGAGAEYLLFTLIAAVVTPEEAVVFTCGDGLIGVNGEIRAIGPDEAPPYLAYALLGGEAEFIVQCRLPASGLDSLALGSDGAIELRLDALLKDELIFRNPDGLRRRLATGPRPGDDATLILLRRRAQ
jgi:hypothetical protein